MPDGKNETTDTRVRTTAHYVLEALNEIGIEYMFCNFGTDHAPLIEELARWERQGLQAPKVIICPHENVAVHMAGGYARATGRGQAVLVHVDAGTANAAMGLHNLFRNRIPILLIAGAAPFTSFGELGGTRDTYVHFIQQPFDQGSLVRPYIKWEYTLPSGVTTKETLRRAHSIMQSEPTGPVYLMLPREVLTQEWSEDAIRSFPSEVYGAYNAVGTDPALIDKLADRIIAAKDPVLITSYAGRDAAASDSIEKLARFAGIRVIDFLVSSNISSTFDHFGGFRPEGLDTVDLGLLVDIDVPWIPSETRSNPETFWAQIDVDVMKGASPIWSFPAHLRLQGRSSRILEQLLAALEKKATSEFNDAAAQRVAKLEKGNATRKARMAELAAQTGEIGAISPHHLCAELGKVVRADDIIINEAVTTRFAPHLQIPRPKPGTILGNAGGGLGGSGGMALGYKLAYPERLVVQLVGDGSFYFGNPSAVLSISKQYNLPIFIVILDNSGWAAVKTATLSVYPEGIAKAQGIFQSNLASGMDFAKIAEAAGAYGEKLVDPAEVPAAIGRCTEQVRNGRTALLHVRVTKH